MKILIKDNENNLVWKEAVYKNGKFCLSDTGVLYDQLKIYSLKDDNRNKIVICSACGKEIRNTPSAIKAHQNMVNQPNKCFECDYLKRSNQTLMSQKYVLNEDGTYTESTKRTVNLVCNKNWSYYDINSPEARNRCRYAGCENAVLRHIEDFWTKYPKAFDEFITIDRIIDDGYKNISKDNYGVVIDLTGRANLTAYINNQGLCYEFQLRYRNRYYTLRYSKKYDKVWAIDYSFKELSHLDISYCIEAATMKKLRSLYE